MTAYKNMNQHPIDDLFRRNLENMESETSGRAKELFLKQLEARQQTKRTIIPFRWQYGIAAMLFLGLSFGAYTVLQDNTNKVISEVKKVDGQMEPIFQEIPKPADQLAMESPSVSMVEPKVLVNKKPNKLKRNITETVEPIDLTPEHTFVKASGVEEIDELIPDKLTLALQQSQKAEKMPKNLEEKDGIFRKGVGETLIIVSSDFEHKEEIMLPDVNADSRISLNQAREMGMEKMGQEKSLLAKVYRELLHFKHGEKVNLGNDALALNDDTLLGHEALEMKERIGRIKQVFSHK